MLIDPGFRALFGLFDLAAMDAETSTIYGLWPDLTIAYVNEGWLRFARDNGVPEASPLMTPLGSPVMEAISGPVHDFYAEAFARVLEQREPWEHVYECNSSVLLRKFHMKVYPMGYGEGLFTVHSLRVESLHDPGERPPHRPIQSLYRDATGLIVQCSHCRRVRRASDPHTWDWVPAFVDQMPPGVSHGLCPICLDYYYPPNDENLVGI